ncbi:hypothetical protein D3C80_1951880 [compost metagenome]
MEVGTQPAGIFRLADGVAAGFAAGIEIDPPHCQATDKGHQRGDQHRRCPGFHFAEGRTGNQNGFPQRHDHEQLAALRQMMTFYGPFTAAVGAAQQRQAETEHR